MLNYNNEVIFNTLYIHVIANINDRSMLGDRDTELALIVEDESYSKSLRCHLARYKFKKLKISILDIIMCYNCVESTLD